MEKNVIKKVLSFFLIVPRRPAKRKGENSKTYSYSCFLSGNLMMRQNLDEEILENGINRHG
jgi:hypothetical protein